MVDIYLYLLWFINQLITGGAPPCGGSIMSSVAKPIQQTYNLGLAFTDLWQYIGDGLLLGLTNYGH